MGSFREENGTELATNFMVAAAVSSAVYTMPFTESTTTNCQPPTIAMPCPVNVVGHVPEGTTDGMGLATHDAPPVQVLKIVAVSDAVHWPPINHTHPDPSRALGAYFTRGPELATLIHAAPVVEVNKSLVHDPLAPPP